MRVSRTLSRAKGGPRFTTPKNDKGRPVTLTREAIEALRSHRKDQNEVRLKLWVLSGRITTLYSLLRREDR